MKKESIEKGKKATVAKKDRDRLLQMAGAIACEVVAMPYNINCNSNQIAAISVGIAHAVFIEVDELIAQEAGL